MTEKEVLHSIIDVLLTKGRLDTTKLTKKQIIDRRGRKTTKWVRTDKTSKPDDKQSSKKREREHVRKTIEDIKQRIRDLYKKVVDGTITDGERAEGKILENRLPIKEREMLVRELNPELAEKYYGKKTQENGKAVSEMGAGVKKEDGKKVHPKNRGIPKKVKAKKKVEEIIHLKPEDLKPVKEPKKKAKGAKLPAVFVRHPLPAGAAKLNIISEGKDGGQYEIYGRWWEPGKGKGALRSGHATKSDLDEMKKYFGKKVYYEHAEKPKKGGRSKPINNNGGSTIGDQKEKRAEKGDKARGKKGGKGKIQKAGEAGDTGADLDGLKTGGGVSRSTLSSVIKPHGISI